MAEIKKYPKDRIVMIEFSEDELDKLREIAFIENESTNDMILACFQIGIIKLMAKTMHDKLQI